MHPWGRTSICFDNLRSIWGDGSLTKICGCYETLTLYPKIFRPIPPNQSRPIAVIKNKEFNTISYFHNDFLRNACWRGRENNFPPLVEINLEIWTTHDKADGGCQVWKKTPIQLEFRHNGGEEEQHPGLSQSHAQTLPSANQVGDQPLTVGQFGPSCGQIEFSTIIIDKCAI